MSGTGTTRLSRSTEDYLRLIYELGCDGEEVGVSKLAGRLGISAASVTGMAKRLAEAGLVDRTPYHGLSLTGEGRKSALGVVRRHRLIELYLLEALGYPWDEVHEEAERMEHAASERFVDRLEWLLGYPEMDAHGSSIPTREGEVVEQPYVPLAGLNVGDRSVIRRVLDRDPEVLRYLAGMGLSLGARLEVVERHPFGGPLIVDSGGKSLVMSPNLARQVFVEPAPVRSEDGASEKGLPGMPQGGPSRVALAQRTR